MPAQLDFKKYILPTFVGSVHNRQILLAVQVSDPSRTSNQTYHSYQALLDTGAQMTLVTEKVESEVGLVPIGSLNITVADGNTINTNKYMVRLGIPISNFVRLPGGTIGHQNVMRGSNLEVGELPYNPANHDVLVGMDFIHHFHITLYSDNLILSS